MEKKEIKVVIRVVRWHAADNSKDVSWDVSDDGGDFEKDYHGSEQSVDADVAERQARYESLGCTCQVVRS